MVAERDLRPSFSEWLEQNPIDPTYRRSNRTLQLTGLAWDIYLLVRYKSQFGEITSARDVNSQTPAKFLSPVHVRHNIESLIKAAESRGEYIEKHSLDEAGRNYELFWHPRFLNSSPVTTLYPHLERSAPIQSGFSESSPEIAPTPAQPSSVAVTPLVETSRPYVKSRKPVPTTSIFDLNLPIRIPKPRVEVKVASTPRVLGPFIEIERTIAPAYLSNLVAHRPKDIKLVSPESAGPKLREIVGARTGFKAGILKSFVGLDPEANVSLYWSARPVLAKFADLLAETLCSYWGYHQSQINKLGAEDQRIALQVRYIQNQPMSLSEALFAVSRLFGFGVSLAKPKPKT